MSSSYEISILKKEEIHTLPGIWSTDMLRQVLIEADLDDIADIEPQDLLDMALMALQDLGNQAAGELVLKVVFGDAMRPGVRQNLVDDLEEDQPWQDLADVLQQQGLFTTTVLLQQAFPTRYGTPDALQIRVAIHALNESAASHIDNIDDAALIRLLACGMDEQDILLRLYKAELHSGEFNDAPGLVWHRNICDDPESAPNTRIFDIISSRQWLEPLSKGQLFKADLD